MFAAFKFYKARAIMMEFHYKINKEKALDLQRENDGLRQQLQDFQNQAGDSEPISRIQRRITQLNDHAKKVNSEIGVVKSRLQELSDSHDLTTWRRIISESRHQNTLEILGLKEAEFKSLAGDLEKKFNDATARAMKAESDLGVENSKIEILNKRLEETSSRVQEAQAQFELASTRANDVQTRLQLLSDKMSETENKFKREVAKGESLARDLIAERDQRILLNEQVRVCEVKIKELKLEVENGRAYTLRVRKDATTKIVQSFNSALDRVQADSSILNSRAVVPEAPPFKGNLPAP